MENASLEQKPNPEAAVTGGPMPPKPLLGIGKIIGTVLILAIIGLIIGSVFGPNAYAGSGYFSGLNNIIVGPIVVGLGLLLFALSYKLIPFWYVYPLVGYVGANAVISRDDLYKYQSQSINNHLVAGVGIFAVYLIVFLVISGIKLLSGRNRLNAGTIVGLTIVLVAPLGLKTANTTILADTEKPAVQETLTLAGLTVTPNIHGASIGYDDFYDTDTYIDYQGGHTEKISVVDDLVTKTLALGKRNQSCTTAVDPEGDTQQATYTPGRTPKGTAYGEADFQTIVSKAADGTLGYEKTAVYCFYSSPLEYTITRHIPTDDSRLPKRSTVDKAYSAYPIEKVIDSFSAS